MWRLNHSSITQGVLLIMWISHWLLKLFSIFVKVEECWRISIRFLFLCFRRLITSFLCKAILNTNIHKKAAKTRNFIIHIDNSSAQLWKLFWLYTEMPWITVEKQEMGRNPEQLKFTMLKIDDKFENAFTSFVS